MSKRRVLPLLGIGSALLPPTIAPSVLTLGKIVSSGYSSPFRDERSISKLYGSVVPEGTLAGLLSRVEGANGFVQVKTVTNLSGFLGWRLRRIADAGGVMDI